MESVWALRRRRSLMQRTWGDETVVYDRLSGNTHLFDPVTAAVLDHLNASHASAAAIAKSLRTEFKEDSEDDVVAAVRAALARLRDIGLVRSIDE